MSFYCATRIPGTSTAWLCQEGYFLIILLWRELSLLLRLNLEVLNMHLSLLTSVLLSSETIIAAHMLPSIQINYD